MPTLPVVEIMGSCDAHARETHAPEYEAGSAYANGRFCPVGEAAVPITDTGFFHADATYDVVTSSRGYIFRLDDHLDRFERSCEIFKLTNPYSRTETTEIIKQLVKLSGLKDTYIWWCVTRGDFPAGPNKTDPSAYQNRFFAFVVPYRFMSDDKMRARGLDVKISEKFVRITADAVDPRAKNFHWMDMKQAMFEAGSQGFDWSVLSDGSGNLVEAPGCNIFVVNGDTLETPADGCLEGITRLTALELADEMGLKTEVGAVPVERLLRADEAFVCSSAGGIMPINSVNRIVLGGVAGPGDIVTRLHNLYWEKRWSGWKGIAMAPALST